MSDGAGKNERERDVRAMPRRTAARDELVQLVDELVCAVELDVRRHASTRCLEDHPVVGRHLWAIYSSHGGVRAIYEDGAHGAGWREGTHEG